MKPMRASAQNDFILFDQIKTMGGFPCASKLGF